MLGAVIHCVVTSSCCKLSIVAGSRPGADRGPDLWRHSRYLEVRMSGSQVNSSTGSGSRIRGFPRRPHRTFSASRAGRSSDSSSEGAKSMVEHAGRIVVSGLTKTFGGKTAVHDLSFTVEPGSIAGFLGPNGAGKTTTLRMLLGLVTPDAGSATIGGRRYATLPRPADEGGAVLDSSGFHPRRSGRSHLRLYCAVSGYPGSRRDDGLAMVGLADVAGRPVGG